MDISSIRLKRESTPVELILKPSKNMKNKEKPAGPETTTEIKALLFADVVGYSKMGETSILSFANNFLGAIADLASSKKYAPVIKQTWGDAFYFVFDCVIDAAHFALDMCEMVSTTDWAEKGLNEEINLRIALHAGPVHRIDDPVAEFKSYTGSHVSFAARIEPITPPGHVYASEGFAAMLAIDIPKDITCDFVGLTEFAKGFGKFRLYHIRRNPGN